jgi:hypothetical protein
MNQVLTETVIFFQVHGKPGIIEAKLPDRPTLDHLHEALVRAGVAIEGINIFIDESERHEQGKRSEPLAHIKHGSRVHVTHCARIKTTVNFLEKQVTRDFPPGAKVQNVKDWVVGKFEIDPKDAAAHVLRLCNSTQQPPTDTRLIELVRGRECGLCFDLVPDKRVEGQ